MTPDLDLKAAREGAARFYEDELGMPGMANRFRSGDWDEQIEVRSALSAIRIRREMEAAWAMSRRDGE